MYCTEELRWNGWGLRRRKFDLHGQDVRVWNYLRESLNMKELRETPAISLENCALPSQTISQDRMAALREIVEVRTSDVERARHALGVAILICFGFDEATFQALLMQSRILRIMSNVWT